MASEGGWPDIPSSSVPRGLDLVEGFLQGRVDLLDVGDGGAVVQRVLVRARGRVVLQDEGVQALLGRLRFLLEERPHGVGVPLADHLLGHARDLRERGANLLRWGGWPRIDEGIEGMNPPPLRRRRLDAVDGEAGDSWARVVVA
eukprot:7470432-Pyramimonas_sp.AAC.1